MPILGTGIVPSGAQGTELQYITRRAFIPELIVSAYQATPTLAAALANSKTAMGGISGVTVPVQGAALVTTQWSGFAGTFNQPSYQQGIWNIEFNLALAITPIAFVGPEALVQDEHAVIPRIHAVMNDATNNMVATFTTSLFTSTGTDPTQWQGLPCAIDDGTNAATYGGLSRTTYTWLKSPVTANMGGAATRLLILRNIAKVYAASSEMPNFGVCGVATWYNLATDYINNEAFRVLPDGQSFDQLDRGAQSGFMAVTVGGVPIFADLNCPEGTLYLWNTHYLALYLHHRTRFDFTGFYSTMGNWQLGFVGAVCTAGQLVNAKPLTCGRFAGYTFPTL
jgi:hypothetical protein